MNGVKYVSKSHNAKISSTRAIDATYSSIKSCPSTCAFKSGQCYAQLGPVGIHVNRLTKESVNMTSRQLAYEEAKVIDGSYKGGKVPNVNLRVHVSGDCSSLTSVNIVNKAIGRWKSRGGNIAYTYTHAWDQVMREQWSNVSVLASIDSIDQATYARQNGYAPSLVVSEHPSDKVYTLESSDVKWIPCPAQTKKVTCEKCKLCMNADRLFEKNMGITFSAHGVKKNEIKRRLNVIK